MFKQFSFKNLGQNKAAGLATEMRYTAVKAKNVLHHSWLFYYIWFYFYIYQLQNNLYKNALSSLIRPFSQANK